MSQTNKLMWAEQLAEIGVRAVTMSNVLGISDVTARAIFKAHQKVNPPSGQTPTDPMWFVKTSERSFHAAFFLMFYNTVRPQVSTRGLAFCHAYVSYWRSVGQPNLMDDKKLPLPPERANLLTKLMDDQKEIKGVYKAPIRLCKCRACNSQFLGLVDKVQAYCPICEDGKKN